jgi:hypothetical protein
VDSRLELSSEHPSRVRSLIGRVGTLLSIDEPRDLASYDVRPPSLLLAHVYAIRPNHDQVEIDGAVRGWDLATGDYIPTGRQVGGQPFGRLPFSWAVPVSQNVQARHQLSS